MPKVAPQVLMLSAANTTEDVTKQMSLAAELAEPAIKDAQVQTLFRDSEAQTAPYAPNYVLKEGEDDPDLLLLKKLTYENGLPLGKEEMNMIEFARAKRELENSLPPFTDEASLNLRKKLMEQQEMREFKMRENEMDARRDAKISDLQHALAEREESNEFMASQRIESMRLLRMEEREKALQKIRIKRIKALRRLAHQRDKSDPVLSDGTAASKDIINNYFDRGSTAYAPIKRDGKNPAPGASKFDVASRTLPLDNIGNILNLEYSMPEGLLNNMPQQMSKTTNALGTTAKKPGRGGQVAEHRLTSAAQRAIRMTKKDVEDMHLILMQKKFDGAGVGGGTRGTESASSPGFGQRASSSAPVTRDGTASGTPRGGLLNKKAKGRPSTPDFTRDRSTRPGQSSYNPAESPEVNLAEDELQAATILLQRLLRGRAAQNIFYEGKLRRKDLIAELQRVEAEMELQEIAEENVAEQAKLASQKRSEALRNSTVDAVAGGASSNLLFTLAQEKLRVKEMEKMQMTAERAEVQRREQEAEESGRRQREGMVYPPKED